MKRFLALFLTLLCVLSCAKVELIDVKNERQIEIGYNTVCGRVSTKALGANQRVFADTNVFQSYAYYLPKGTNWVYSNASGDNGSKPYFNKDVIVRKDSVKNVWRDTTTTWYWPKNSALTFFAWSLNSPTLDFPAGSPTIVGCNDQNGIIAADYDIEINKNIDFLVADIAADKTANENVYSYLGVPTLFRHKLSQFHATVMEKEDYPDIEFTLDKIVFNDLNKDGNYTQNPDTLVCGTTRSDQVYTDVSQKVDNTTPEDVKNVNQSIYLPQDFDDDKTITIIYTIGYDTDGDGVIDFTETVENTYKLSDMYDDGFKPGTRYNLNIVFKLDQIYWDPAVEDWKTDDFEI